MDVEVRRIGAFFEGGGGDVAMGGRGGGGGGISFSFLTTGLTGLS